MTGSQQTGDQHIRLCLEALLEAPERLKGRGSLPVRLFRLFHQTVEKPVAAGRALVGHHDRRGQIGGRARPGGRPRNRVLHLHEPDPAFGGEHLVRAIDVAAGAERPGEDLQSSVRRDPV